MDRQWKREMHALTHATSQICFWTVLGAFGGILLWVHGCGAALVYRTGVLPDFVPGHTLCFLLWLLVYALAGCEMGILFLPMYFRCRGGLRDCLFCVLAYMLTLAWYPLFFSLLHTFLCAGLLLTAIFLHICLFVRALRRFSPVMVPYFISCLLESYFLCVTIAFGIVE